MHYFAELAPSGLSGLDQPRFPLTDNLATYKQHGD